MEKQNLRRRFLTLATTRNSKRAEKQGLYSAFDIIRTILKS
jgi:hypothetical protein